MATKPERLIRELGERLETVSRRSYDDAWGMPAAFYLEPAVHELELAELFGQEWICAGHEQEAAAPGDYFTFQAGSESLLVVRGADGRLRALSNVCRHRGALLAEGRGNSRSFVCPYHAWTYDSSGRLIGAPKLGKRADFNPRDCSLPSFACEVWNGFVFVCLAAEPPPLAERLAGLQDLVAPYHLEQTKLRHVETESWSINWKSFVENYMEGYHLTPLHRETLHPVNPTSLCRHFPAGEGYFGYFAGFSPSLPRPQRGHPGLTDEQAMRCVMAAVPPGLVFGCASDYSSFICVQPEGPEAVRLKMGLIFFDEDWPQDRVDWAVQLYRDTMAEDKTVLLSLMRGLRSARFQPGPLAPADFEGPTLDLYRWLDRRMGPAMRGRPAARNIGDAA